MQKIRISGNKIIEVEGDLFSGVRDKHGKEIFENDDVKIYYKGQFVICKVFFKDGLFGLKWPDGYMNMYPINSNCEIVGSG
jgi:hypothetical protein